MDFTVAPDEGHVFFFSVPLARTLFRVCMLFMMATRYAPSSPAAKKKKLSNPYWLFVKDARFLAPGERGQYIIDHIWRKDREQSGFLADVYKKGRAILVASEVREPRPSTCYIPPYIRDQLSQAVDNRSGFQPPTFLPAGPTIPFIPAPVCRHLRGRARPGGRLPRPPPPMPPPQARPPSSTVHWPPGLRDHMDDIWRQGVSEMGEDYSIDHYISDLDTYVN